MRSTFSSPPPFYMSLAKHFCSHLEEIMSASLAGWFIFLMIIESVS